MWCPVDPGTLQPHCAAYFVYNTRVFPSVKHPFYIFSSAFYIFFQVDGENNNSIGNSSRRPASISNISTNLDKIEKPPKLQVGPTAPSPGPMLFKVAATAVKFDVKSKLSRLTISTDAAYRKKYVIKYAFTELNHRWFNHFSFCFQHLGRSADEEEMRSPS